VFADLLGYGLQSESQSHRRPVLGHAWVVRQQSHTLDARLRDEHAVERVAVHGGQVGHGGGVRT